MHIEKSTDSHTTYRSPIPLFQTLFPCNLKYPFGFRVQGTRVGRLQVRLVCIPLQNPSLTDLGRGAAKGSIGGAVQKDAN